MFLDKGRNPYFFDGPQSEVQDGLLYWLPAPSRHQDVVCFATKRLRGKDRDDSDGEKKGLEEEPTGPNPLIILSIPVVVLLSWFRAIILFGT